MTLPAWLRRFIAAHIVAPEPSTWTATDGDQPAPADVLAQPAPRPRVIPCPCRKPRGVYEMGWAAFAKSDAERAEVICAWLRQKQEAR